MTGCASCGEALAHRQGKETMARNLIGLALLALLCSCPKPPPAVPPPPATKGAEAAEPVPPPIERPIPPVSGMVVSAHRISLPDLDERLGNGRARAVADGSLDNDLLPDRPFRGQCLSALEQQRVMKERANRLKRREPRRHGSSLDGRGVAPAEHDVEPVAERPSLLGQVEIEAR